MDKIGIIIVTYNRCAILKECLDKIGKQTYPEYEIILVDNHSTDETEAYIKSINLSKEKIHYYRLEKNYGGAGGFNFGLKKAIEKGYDYFWLMDDDVICENDSLKELLKVSDRMKPYGYLAGNVLWTDRKACKMNIPLFSLQEEKGYRRVQKSTFVSLFLPRETVEKVGYPIKDFFIWGDDQEYTKRISRIMKCYFVPESIVIHKTKNNNGSNIVHDDTARIGRYFYKYRNEFYISRKTGVLSCLFYFYRIMKDIVFVFFLSNQKKNRISVILSGMKKGLYFNPQIENVKERK